MKTWFSKRAVRRDARLTPRPRIPSPHPRRGGRAPCAAPRPMLMSWPGGLGHRAAPEGPGPRSAHAGGRRSRGRWPRPTSRGDRAARATSSSIEADPAAAGLERLVGIRAGADLRAAIAQELPDGGRGRDAAATSCSTTWPGATLDRRLHLLPLGRRVSRDPASGIEQRARAASCSDICSGFRDGSSALHGRWDPRRTSARTRRTRGPLVDPADPLGWHELARAPGDRHAPGPPDRRMGRGRDSSRSTPCSATACWDPDGTRRPCTSTRSSARPTARRGRSSRSPPIPRVLPYGRMPRGGAERRRGWPEPTSAPSAPRCSSRLRATDCCTHLNDGLRSLAEVPVLAASLPDCNRDRRPDGGSGQCPRR